MKKKETILAIETSCDDTAIAVVEVKDGKFKILSNTIASQAKKHESYGGVYPSLAKKEHQKNLPIVLVKALKDAKIKDSEIDYLALTVGPGLSPCLWEGVNFAIKLATRLDLAIIPTNHIEAHLLVNLIDQDIKFPAIGLIVSGGHTQLVLIKGISKYEILGETRDDAAGECLDKIARMLGLGYPGGPVLAKEASNYSSDLDIALPRPMINTKDYDFSFSGLKTAALYHFNSQSERVRKSKRYIRAISFEAQQAVIDVLIKKTMRAVREYGTRRVILGGGVSANLELRKQFKEKDIDLIVPEANLSTDNAVMIAVAGYYNREKKTKDYSKIEAQPNLRIG